MKKRICFLLALAFVLCSFPVGAFAFEETSDVNLALGAEYAYEEGIVFKDLYGDDAQTLLTDGNIPDVETEGSSVLFQGTYQVVSLTMDLGEDKENVGRIVFRGVNDTYSDENRMGNRGFSKEDTQFYFSTDGINFERNSDFVFSSEEKSNDMFGYYLDYTFSFNAPTNARYVKIIMYSPVFVLSLGEIEIYQSDKTDDVSSEISEGISVDVSEGISVDVSEDVSVDVSEDVSVDVSEDVSVDVSEDVSVDVSEDVSVDVSEDVSEDDTVYSVNYALGAEYAYEDEQAFLGEYDDYSSYLLTDGYVPESPTLGKTAIFTGTRRIVTMVVDLGSEKDDIDRIVFGGVHNSVEEGGNRGFSEEKTMFYFSTDGIEYERNKDFTLTKEEKGTECYYDYTFDFDAPAKARYVKILMYSAHYLLSLGEIGIYGEPENVIAKGDSFSSRKWKFTDKGTLVVSGKWEYSGMEYLHPWKRYQDEVKLLVVEHGISYVDNFSEYSNLEEVYMASSVTSFNKFYRCEKLRRVRLSRNITEIPYLAFNDCYALEEIKLHEGITFIGVSAFENCTSIKEVSFPSTLETLAGFSFANCILLANVKLNEGLMDIEGNAFIGTALYENEDYYDGSLFYIDNILMFRKDLAKDEEIVIREGTTVIAGEAFHDCENVKKIIIPESVVYIGFGAFTCESLEEINIPSGIDVIRGYAFAGCDNLKEITIPESVTIIEENAFAYSGLEKIIIPDKVKTIENSAFYNCENLKEVTIGKSVETIDYWAFADCFNLKSVYIPETVTFIGEEAFGCVFGEFSNEFVICGKKGSEAEKYAVVCGLKFYDEEYAASDFYLDEYTKTLPNLKNGTTVSQIKEAIEGASVTDKDGNELLDTDKIGTGYIVTIADGEDFVAVVLGDVDGDARMNSVDYLQIKGSLCGVLSLENEFFSAADMDKDGKITSIDYMRIKNTLVSA